MLEKLYEAFWLFREEVNRKKLQKNKIIIPNHIKVFRNIKYGEDKEQLFDMFYPKTKKTIKLPTIVHIHGGAYLAGLKDSYAEYCKVLAEKGYCVINFDYIRGMRKGFPSPVYDFFNFFEFIKNNEQFAKHIDFDQFVLSGDSSGGHVASLIANIQTNDNLKQAFNLTGGPNVKACILTSPMLGVYRFNNGWPREIFEKLVFKEYYTSNLKDLTHNLETVTNKFPPTIILSAKNDFIKLHAYMFEKNAKELNLYLEHYCLISGKHLGHCCPLLYPYDYENSIALQKVDLFVKKALTSVILPEVRYEVIDNNKQRDSQFYAAQEFLIPNIEEDCQTLYLQDLNID